MRIVFQGHQGNLLYDPDIQRLGIEDIETPSEADYALSAIEVGVCTIGIYRLCRTEGDTGNPDKNHWDGRHKLRYGNHVCSVMTTFLRSAFGLLSPARVCFRLRSSLTRRASNIVCLIAAAL